MGPVCSVNTQLADVFVCCAFVVPDTLGVLGNCACAVSNCGHLNSCCVTK